MKSFFAVGAGALLAGCNALAGIQAGELVSPDASVDGATDGAADVSSHPDATGDSSGGSDASEGGDGPASGSDGGGSDSAADAGADAAPADAACTGLVCDGGCVSPTDVHNCGACGNDCTTLPHVSGQVSCAASETCSFAVSSCAPGWTFCGNPSAAGCDTDITKTSNCGSCGNVCSGATPECAGSGSSYACVSGCPAADPTLCGSTCVDTQTDTAHCGGCNVACTSAPTHGQPACASSSCTFSCNSGYTACSSACVDTTSDPANCSTCGSACPSGGSCVDSACQCPGTDVVCGGSCVDTATDGTHCGSCGKSCLGGGCAGSVCQPATLASFAGLGAFAIDATSFYVTMGNTATPPTYSVDTCPLTGCAGSPTPIVTGLQAPYYLYTAGTNLYVGTSTTLYSYTKAGAANWNWDGTSVYNQWGITSDATYVYVASGTGLERITIAGGTPSLFVYGGQSGPGFTSIWYDATTNDVYGTLGEATATWGQCNAAGTPPVGCLEETSNNPASISTPYQVLVVGSTLYIAANGSTAAGYADGGIFTAPVSNMRQTTAFAAGFPMGGPMVADATTLYFSAGTSTIQSCPLSGCGSGPATVYAIPNETSVVALAVDASAVYWLETSTATGAQVSAVKKLAK